MLYISNFKNINKKLINFSELDFFSKKSIIWRFSIDCENNFKEQISHFLTENIIESEDLSDHDWGNIIHMADVYFKNTYFLQFEVPTKMFINTILSKNEELRQSFDN